MLVVRRRKLWRSSSKWLFTLGSLQRLMGFRRRRKHSWRGPPRNEFQLLCADHQTLTVEANQTIACPAIQTTKMQPGPLPLRHDNNDEKATQLLGSPIRP